MALWETLKRLVEKDRKHLVYVDIDPSHVDRQIEPVGIEANRHYIRLRLAEMFLKKEEAWFKSWYPAVHCLVRFDFGSQAVEIPNIADASSVGMQKCASGDVIAKNFVMTPTMPFNGGVMTVNAGLIAFKAENHLNSLVKVLGSFACLLNAAQLSSVLSVVQPLAAGIQELFGAGNGRVHLGLVNSFSAGELKAGYIAAIRATEDSIDQSRLWVVQDQLRYSHNKGSSETSPFEACDYFLVRFEVFEKRDDWERLTSIQEPFQEAMRALADPATEPQAIHHLRTALLKARQSPELTGADKRRVMESLKEMFEEARHDLGVRSLRSRERTLTQVMKHAMPVEEALKKGEPTIQEIFDHTSDPSRLLPVDAREENITHVRSVRGNLPHTGAEFGVLGGPDAVLGSARGEEEKKSAPPSVAPSFYFELKGESVRGRQVVCGTDADLVFNYGLADQSVLATVIGEKLDEAAKQDADVGIALIPRGLTFRDGVHYQLGKFRGGRLEQPVCFHLKAADQPVADAGVHVIFDRAGSVLYEFDLSIEVVASLEQVEAPSANAPISLNLDEVVKAFDRLERTVTLHLWAEGDQLSFLYDNRMTGESYNRRLSKLTRTALADRVGKIRDKLQAVTQNPVWSRLGMRIAEPNAAEQKQFQECLERVVDAGSSLHAALSADDDFREVLQRVNALEPDCRLSIRTDCAFLPWEILYPRRFDTEWTMEVKAENPIQLQEIWGYRFAIECLLMAKGASYKSPLEAHRSGELFVSYNLNPTIDLNFQMLDFKPVLAQIEWAQKSAPLVKVDLKNNGNEIKQVLQSKNYRATLIYLYCHGSNDHPFLDNQTERLELDKDIVIDPDFLNDGIQFACGPVVFLNSCSSGAFSPLSFSNFLTRFREKQALGLIATAFPVPAAFAAVFGHEVIQGYIQDRQTPIGLSLLNLRRRLLNQKNPLGLFYSLQCPLDVTAPSSK